MHVRRLHIENIRSIERLEIDIQEPAAGWHVILGDNGSGKSSVVRALALALIGPSDAPATRQDWGDWVRRDAAAGHIEVQLSHDRELDRWAGKGRVGNAPVNIELDIQRPAKDSGTKGAQRALETVSDHADRTIWGGGTGWFSASFGPFRRFTGGDKEYDRLFISNPGLALHLSAFGEEVALGEALRWLQELQFKAYERHPESTALLDGVLDFMRRSALLPHGAQIEEITSDAVLFKDGAGTCVPVEQLSDGFRSVLSMTFEMLRGMVMAYGSETVLRTLDPEATAIRLPGVVAVDEIDSHLHPTWQKRIGDWLTGRFPEVQFVVTTHSPIICRSAAQGSIWRLPTPGSDEQPHQISGKDRDRLVYGSILDALDTEYFGSDVTRSDASYAMMKELATLNMKRSRGRLSGEEERKRVFLQRTLPSVSAAME